MDAGSEDTASEASPTTRPQPPSLTKAASYGDPRLERSVSWRPGLRDSGASSGQLPTSERQMSERQASDSALVPSEREMSEPADSSRNEPSPPPLRRSNSANAADRSNWRRGQSHTDVWQSARGNRQLTAEASFARANSRMTSGSARNRHGVALMSPTDKVAILASYSPRMVIERFQADPAPPSGPSETSFWGAVVFVDVSGFTALSEALSKQHGPVEGAELLNLYINAYFRRLIDAINAAGGDIIKFAGDAMQVIWRVPEPAANADDAAAAPDSNRDSMRAISAASNRDGDDDPASAAARAGMPEQVLNAARCCLSMLTDLHGFSPTRGVTLTLHMGIGAGQLTAFTVGGHLEKWEFFIAGEPIEQMSDAAEIAKAGELVLSPAAAAEMFAALGEGGGSGGTFLPVGLLPSRASSTGSAAPNELTQPSSRSSLGRNSSQFTTGRSSSGSAVGPLPSPRKSSFGFFGGRRSTRPTANDLLDAKLRRGSRSDDGMFTISIVEGATLSRALGVDGFFGAVARWSRTSHSQRDSSIYGKGSMRLPGARSRPRSVMGTPGELSGAHSSLGSLGEEHLDDRQKTTSRFKSFSRRRLGAGGSGRLQSSLLSIRMDRALRCFVPALVEERVEAGQQDEWLSESRKLVTVFMRILGLGARLCEVRSLETLQQVVELVQATTHRYGGQVTRLICDDKGVRFLIGFGMPGRSYQDDESRAVLSSLQLQARLPSLPNYDHTGGLAAAIGITSGTVFCGEAGTERRREYTLAGARVNLSARLMQYAAKVGEKAASEAAAAAATPADFGGTIDSIKPPKLAGEVVVSAEVKEAVFESDARAEMAHSEKAEFVALEPIKVKGKAEPVTVYKATKPAKQIANLLSEQLNIDRLLAGRAPSSAAAISSGGSNLSAASGSSGDALAHAPEAATTLPSPRRHSSAAAHAPSPTPSAAPRLLVGRAKELSRLSAALDAVLEAAAAADTESPASASTKASPPAPSFAKAAKAVASLPRAESGVRDEASVSPAGALHSLVKDAQAAKGSTAAPLFLTGSTGMGKSALLNRFLEEDARPRSPFVISASAVAVEATSPYFIWRGVFQRLLSPNLVEKLGDLSALESLAEPSLVSPRAGRATDGSRNTDGEESSVEEQLRSSMSMPTSASGRSSRRAQGASWRTSAAAAADANASTADAVPELSRQRSAKDRWKSTRAKLAAASAFRSMSFRSPAAASSAASTSGADGSGGNGSDAPTRPPPMHPKASSRALWTDATLSVMALNPRGIGLSVRPALDEQLLSDPIVRRLAPLLNPVLAPMVIEENAYTRGLQGNIRATQQLKVMLRVLEIKLAGVRGVIAFEDCQWMDNSAWRLVREAMPLLRGRMLVLIITRASLLEARAFQPRQQSPGAASHEALEVLYRTAHRAGNVLRLDGLSADGVRHMMAAQLDVPLEHIQGVLTNAVADRSQGNPLHVIEMVKLLKERGVIEVVPAAAAARLGLAMPPAEEPLGEDGAPKGSPVATPPGSPVATPPGSPVASAKPGHLHPLHQNVLLVKVDLELKENMNEFVPDSLKAIVTERIDRLSPTLQMLLKVCAVVCHGTFELHMVNAVSPMKLLHADLLRLLGELEALDIITSIDEKSRELWSQPSAEGAAAAGHNNDSYKFNSTLVQEVTYRKLPERQRRDLHSKAADEIRLVMRRIEQRETSAKPGHSRSQYCVAMLAYHFCHSGKAKPALRYLSMAANNALEHAAYADALAFFEDALTIVERQKELLREEAKLPAQDREAAEAERARTSDGDQHVSDGHLLDCVHAHLLHQSAVCCTSIGELEQGAARLVLALRLVAVEEVSFLNPSRSSGLLLGMRCFWYAMDLLLQTRARGSLLGVAQMAPSADVLQEARDVVACSPLNENELPASSLQPRRRQGLRIAAMYEQLAIALEALESIDGDDLDTRLPLYCAMRATRFALRAAKFLTPTLARCYATLSLVHTSHAASGEAGCASLDVRLGRHYHEYARTAFASEALAERSKSDLAWGLLTEGLIVSSAAKWDHALRSLRAAAELLDELQAAPLYESCMVHIAYALLAKGATAEAREDFLVACDSAVERGDALMQRRTEAGLAAIALLEGDLGQAGELLADTSALGLLSLQQLRTQKSAAALCSAFGAQSAQATGGGRKDEKAQLAELHASTWVLLQLLQNALARAEVRDRRQILSRGGRAWTFAAAARKNSRGRGDKSAAPRMRRTSLRRTTSREGSTDSSRENSLVGTPTRAKSRRARDMLGGTSSATRIIEVAAEVSRKGQAGEMSVARSTRRMSAISTMEPASLRSRASSAAASDPGSATSDAEGSGRAGEPQVDRRPSGARSRVATPGLAEGSRRYSLTGTPLAEPSLVDSPSEGGNSGRRPSRRSQSADSIQSKPKPMMKSVTSKFNTGIEDAFRRVEETGAAIGGIFGAIFAPWAAGGEADYDADRGPVDADWESLLDDLPTLYSWATTAVQRLTRFSRSHPTAVPAAGLCRVALFALHADDTGGGARYSTSAASQLREIAVQAKQLGMPFERARALHMIGVYSSIPSDRSNALRQAQAAFTETGATFHAEACARLRQEVLSHQQQQNSTHATMPRWHREAGESRSRMEGTRKLGRRISAGSGFFLRKFTLSAGGTRPPFLDLCALEEKRPADHPAACVVAIGNPPAAAAPVVAAPTAAALEAVSSIAEGRASTSTSTSAPERRASTDFEVVGLGARI